MSTHLITPDGFIYFEVKKAAKGWGFRVFDDREEDDNVVAQVAARSRKSRID